MCVLSGALAGAKGVAVVVVVGHALTSVRVVMVAFAFVVAFLDLLIVYAVRDVVFRSSADAAAAKSVNGGAATARDRLARLARGDLDEMAPLVESQSPAASPSSGQHAFAPRHSTIFAGSQPEERFAQSQQRRFSAPSAAVPITAAVGSVGEPVGEVVYVSPSVSSKPVRPSLARLCERMSRPNSGLTVGDRVDVFKTHKQCFVGSEAIDWMCLHLGHLFPSRRLALDCAQELLTNRFILSATCQCGVGDAGVQRPCECTFRDSSRSFFRWSQGLAPVALPPASAPIPMATAAAVQEPTGTPSPAVSSLPATAMMPMQARGTPRSLR